MDPINYGAGFQNPINTFNAAVQGGTAILDSQIKRDTLDATIAAREEAARLAREKMAAAAAEQARIQAILLKLQQPGATFEDYQRASMLLPKDQAEAIQKAAVSMKEEERKTALTDSAQIFSAFKLGEPTLAAALIRKHAEAERTAGNTKGAEFAEVLAQAAEKSPKGAMAVEQFFGYQITGLPGGKDAMDAIVKLEEERRTTKLFPTLEEQKKTDLAAAKTDEEKNIIEAQYKEKREKAEIDLIDAQAWALLHPRQTGAKDPEADKTVNKANDEIDKATRAASKSEYLAKAIGKLTNTPKGLIAEGWAELKKISGNQNIVDELRQEYIGIKANEAMSHLPAGNASDMDVKLVKEPYPDVNSNPAFLAKFLSGMGRLQRYTVDYNKAKLQWLSQYGSMRTADEDGMINGIKVKKGQNFWEITDKLPYPDVVGTTAPAAAATTTPNLTLSYGGQTLMFASQAQMDAFKTDKGIK